MDDEIEPELSVLIVNWNTRDMTLACLASLYAETVTTRFEVLLIDNGSVDGSAAAIAEAFPQVRLIAEPVNHGFALANNIAAKQSRGRYLLLLNTDTLVLDRAIDRLLDFAHETPDARIWGGRTVFADRSLNPTSAWRRPTLWSTICFAVGLVSLGKHTSFFDPEGMGGWRRDSRRQVDIVSGCFFLIEAGFWRTLGGFDRAFFMYGEEADLCARARAAGARPMMTPDATIVHYGGISTAHMAHKIVYIFGAKMGLMRRYMPPLIGGMSCRTMLFAAWWRAMLFGAGARLLPKRFQRSASEWRETWDRRAEWREGPLAAAIGDDNPAA